MRFGRRGVEARQPLAGAAVPIDQGSEQDGQAAKRAAGLGPFAEQVTSL